MVKLDRYALILLLGILFLPGLVCAANPDDHSNRIALKLQAMLRELTAERDRLVSEKTTLTAEIEQLQKQLAAEKQLSTAAAAAETRLSGELNSAKTYNERLIGQLESNRAKYSDLNETYRKSSRENKQVIQQLSAQLAESQRLHAFVEKELDGCGINNVNLLKDARDMAEKINKRSALDTLLAKEPILGFKQVEIENQLQSYQDKLNAQRYQKKSAIESMSPPETASVDEEADGVIPADTLKNGPEDSQ